MRIIDVSYCNKKQHFHDMREISLGGSHFVET